MNKDLALVAVLAGGYEVIQAMKKENGRQTGRKNGRETGRENGRENGRETGRENGRETGQENGRENRRENDLENGLEPDMLDLAPNCRHKDISDKYVFINTKTI